MLTKIELITNNLKKIFDHWQLTNKEKRDQIYLILPFIQFASFFGVIFKNDTLDKILSDFSKNYIATYSKRLQLKKADFSCEIYKHINSIENNEKPTLAKKDFALLLSSYDNKYFHAYCCLIFSFGTLIVTSGFYHFKEILKFRDEIRDANLMNNENFINLFLDKFDELNFQQSINLMQIDEIEKSILLNYSNQFQNNIKTSISTLLDQKLFNKAKENISNFDPYIEDIKNPQLLINIDNSISKIDEIKNHNYKLNIVINLGFSLLSSNDNDERFPISPHILNTKIKEQFSDIFLNKSCKSTISLSKYLLLDNDVTNLDLVSEYKFYNMLAIDKKDCRSITIDLETRLNNYDIKIENYDKITNITKNLTRIEVFFYKILFLNNNELKNYKIKIKNIFDYSKTEQNNFNYIFSLLLDNKLHQSLIESMSNNHISFEICEQSLSDIEKIHDFLQFIARDTGLIIKNKKSFVSFSLIKEQNNILKMDKDNICNALAVEFFKINESSFKKIKNNLNKFKNTIPSDSVSLYAKNKPDEGNISLNFCNNFNAQLNISNYANKNINKEYKEYFLTINYDLKNMLYQFINNVITEFNDLLKKLSIDELNSLHKQKIIINKQLTQLSELADINLLPNYANDSKIIPMKKINA